MQDNVGVDAHAANALLDLDTERVIESDQRTQVFAGLCRVDIDGADEFKTVTLGNQPGRRAADWPKPILNYPNLLLDGRISSGNCTEKKGSKKGSEYIFFEAGRAAPTQRDNPTRNVL
jgi:hypothetical protein